MEKEAPVNVGDENHYKFDVDVYWKIIIIDKEILSVMNSLETKNSQDIYISTKLLKQCVPLLAKPLTEIINNCLSEGYFLLSTEKVI